MSSTTIEVTDMTGRSMRDELKRELEEKRLREQEIQEEADRAAYERDRQLRQGQKRFEDEIRMDEARKALYSVPSAMLSAASAASDALRVPITWSAEPSMTLNKVHLDALEADPTSLDDAGLSTLVEVLITLAHGTADTALFEAGRVSEAESAIATFDSAAAALANMRPSIMALMEDRLEAYRAAELAAKKYASDASAALEAAQAERKNRQPMTAGEIKAALDEQQQAINKLAGSRRAKK